MKKVRGSSSTRSWREIRQSANPKVVTAHARKRMLRGLARALVIVLLLAGAGVGTYFGILHWQQGLEKVNTALPPQPLREIVFETDGVLTKRWAERVLNLPDDADLNAIDIHATKTLFERFGQIESASIRRLPGQLTVQLRERRPVVRLATRDGKGNVVALLVDRNGVVYRGIGYDRHELATLPFLAGVGLRREGEGFRRLRGIDQVDELLRAVHNYSPRLHDSWKIIDCSDLPLIKVRSDEIREIVFGPGRYEQQLQWLDMIVENNRRQMMGMQERVDLSLGNQVVVR